MRAFGDLAFVDAVVEMAVVDEEVRAASVTVGQDGKREVEAEDDHAGDAAAVVAVDPRCNGQAAAACLDGEVCLAAFSLETLCVLGEEQHRFVRLLSALMRVGVPSLLELYALPGDLPGARLQGLRRFEVMA